MAFESSTGSRTESRVFQTLHPFQRIARLQLEEDDYKDLVLAAIGLRLIALKYTNGAVLADWNAEITGSSGIISLLTVSPDNTYVALVTSEDKAVHVVSTSPSSFFTPLNRRILPKRPSCISWSSDGQHLLVGDKFGDVYALTLHEPARSSVEQRQISAITAAIDTHNTVLILPSADSTPGEDAESSDLEAPPSKRYKPSATESTVHSGRNLRALENQKRAAVIQQLNKKKELDPNLSLALGHVSMLTALHCQRVMKSSIGESEEQSDDATQKVKTRAIDEKCLAWRDYIITADRDEHIRISRGLPQSHVIESFCLGHTSFVSALCILTHTSARAANLMFSGGGDNWIGCWEWLEAKLMFRISLAFVLHSLPPRDENEGTLAVTGIWEWPLPAGEREERIRLVVTCEDVPGIAICSSTTPKPLTESDFSNLILPIKGKILDVAIISPFAILAAIDTGPDCKQSPRLFVHNEQTEDVESFQINSPDVTLMMSEQLDSLVAEQITNRGLQTPLTGEDRIRLESLLFGVEKLRKRAGDSED